MALRVGINGFGRMGRLALRAGIDRDDLAFVAVNEPEAEAEVMAHLLAFDSVQGRFDRSCSGADEAIQVGDHRLRFSRFDEPGQIDWSESGVDLVLECSGRFRQRELLQDHLDRGASQVLVSAPVKDGPPNVVYGVNHESVNWAAEPITTAASCTTNCLAPLARVLHDAFGIEHGLITTIHDPTNTQVVHDRAHRDPRRARAASLNLIPTSTNSATAVGLIIPELAGRLDALAVRAPVLNASLTDATLRLGRDVTRDEVNAVLRDAATTGPLAGILGYEERPLVSSDYVGDPRSAIVDAASTVVVGDRLVKVLAWYDNEWGYANRMIDLAGLIAAARSASA